VLFWQLASPALPPTWAQAHQSRKQQAETACYLLLVLLLLHCLVLWRR
jgi:hypothetical protein